MLETLAEQTATALDRASLAREMVSARSAAETERVRNTLLASISHDFRTPLASILGSATSLLEYGDKLDAKAQKDLLGQIKTEAEGLEDMVRNLLAMTRIDAGALELHRDWVDLRELAERVANAARRRGAEQQIEVRLADGLPLVKADARLIEQALGNVVGNAIAHTPPEAHILIDAEVARHAVIVRVTDDGPGIPKDMLPHIFEKFVRSGDPGLADGGEGTGLGLAIAKGIMDAHGGSVAVESPVTQGPRRAAGLRLSARKGHQMTGKPRVLVVDDEPAILRFLRPALEANGFEVAAAATAAEAMKRIAGERPEIVVLDLGLPDGDGKDVIRQVRQWSDVPIIVLSAREREAEKIEALDLGADDFVNKPFGVGELMARLRAALRHRAQRQGETPVLSVADVEIDMVRYRVTRDGQEIKLTRKEFELLASLARHAGKVMTHRQLLSAVWGPAHAQDTQYLRVYIGQLRQKLEADPGDPKIILTELGIGYRLADT